MLYAFGQIGARRAHMSYNILWVQIWEWMKSLNMSTLELSYKPRFILESSPVSNAGPPDLRSTSQKNYTLKRTFLHSLGRWNVNISELEWKYLADELDNFQYAFQSRILHLIHLYMHILPRNLHLLLNIRHFSRIKSIRSGPRPNPSYRFNGNRNYLE